MPVKSAQIEKQALGLPDKERALLAASLIGSLKPEAEMPGYAEEWQKEAQRRLGEFESGLAKASSWSAVRKRIEEKVRAQAQNSSRR